MHLIDTQIIFRTQNSVVWPRGLRHRSATARQLRLWVRIPPGAWMYVCCEYCVLSSRELCDELITRPEESYRLYCVVVCDLETSWMRRPWPMVEIAKKKKKKKKSVGGRRKSPRIPPTQPDSPYSGDGWGNWVTWRYEKPTKSEKPFSCGFASGGRFGKRHRPTKFPNSHALRVMTVFIQRTTELHIASRRETTRRSFRQSTKFNQKINLQCVYFQLFSSTSNMNRFNYTATRRILRIVPTITGILSHHGKSFYIPGYQQSLPYTDGYRIFYISQ